MKQELKEVLKSVMLYETTTHQVFLTNAFTSIETMIDELNVSIEKQKDVINEMRQWYKMVEGENTTYHEHIESLLSDAIVSLGDMLYNVETLNATIKALNDYRHKVAILHIVTLIKFNRDEI